MKIPKRFKLHEVAELDDTNIAIYDLGKEFLVLVASFSNGIAIVPITVDTKIDLPCMTWDENLKELPISSKAIKEAVKGKMGIGELKFRKNDIMVRGGEDKNWIIIPNQNKQIINKKAIEQLKEQVEARSPKGYHYAEVCLNAELLATLSRAIGTSKVRLRFLVDAHSKVANGQGSNLIHITPYKKDGDGEEAILSMLVTNK